ncbi:MAG: hypothetical protein ACFNYO_00965 [Candidatus Saccharimonas sp.]|jgi:hypothetical protein
MSELPYLLTATPSEHPRGASSQPAIDPMPTPLTAKLAGVPGLDIAGIVNRGLEKNENGNPSVKAARGIGGTASRVMLRNLADQANSIDPNAVVGAQGENNPTAARLLDDLEKRVKAGEVGALAAPIPPKSLEMINNLNGRVEERGGQAGE